ncbi:uncharacterized protein LOC144014382 [Festucalex cinctus]
MRLKMKLPFVLLLLDVPGLLLLQMVEEFGDMFLTLEFPPIYRGHVKSCCKVYQSGCQTVLDSTGYTADFLRGRVSVTETDSWIEFKVTRARMGDGGNYRCALLGTPVNIYSDHRFYVFGASFDQHNPSWVPQSTRTESPELTGAEEGQETGDLPTSRTLWTFGALAAISVSFIVVVASVIVVLYFRGKTKSKHLDMFGKTESAKEDATETSGVIYTTVDFRSESYATEAPDAGGVEYSVLAVHQ